MYLSKSMDFRLDWYEMFLFELSEFIVNGIGKHKCDPNMTLVSCNSGWLCLIPFKEAGSSATQFLLVYQSVSHNLSQMPSSEVNVTFNNNYIQIA